MNRWCTHELRKANMRTVLSRYSKCSASHGEHSPLPTGVNVRAQCASQLQGLNEDCLEGEPVPRSAARIPRR